MLVNLGRHDLILGRKWMEYFNIDLAVRDRRLVWPADLPPQQHFNRHISLTREVIARQRPDPWYQRDAQRRDKAIEVTAILARPRWPNSILLKSPEATPLKEPVSDAPPSVDTTRTYPEVCTRGF